MGRGGRAAPQWECVRAQKDGCAQRTGAHARQKPLVFESLLKIIYVYIYSIGLGVLHVFFYY